jgi:hypothetical protein
MIKGTKIGFRVCLAIFHLMQNTLLKLKLKDDFIAAIYKFLKQVDPL